MELTETQSDLIQLLKELAIILWSIPDMDKSSMIGILNPLETEEQIKEMMEYLKTIDLKTTKISPIIQKALEIGN